MTTRENTIAEPATHIVSPSHSQVEDGRETMRWLASTFESAQSERIRRGERLRGALSLRFTHADAVPDADALLRAIEKGTTLGPVPMLGSMYWRAWTEEQELSTLLEGSITDHPAWPWLVQIRGIGPRLAVRLLARLDLTKARSPSSFWAFCGLGTVEGQAAQCEACGRGLLFSASSPEPREHRSPTGTTCRGTLHVRRQGIRIAQPRPRRTERRAYDATAKTVCYLVGASFTRQGGPYKAYYIAAYTRLALKHPTWQRKHLALAAMRAAVKLFLKHLWMVWRDAAGLPLLSVPAGDATPGPWEMVSPPSIAKQRMLSPKKPRAEKRQRIAIRAIPARESAE